MRRILFIILSLVSISVRAEFKTVQQAMSEAQNFISCRQQQSQAKGIRKTKDLVLVTETQDRANGAKAEDDMPAYYIFNYADSTGFVIVSAESETLSILAYSDTDYFHVEDIDKGADIFLNQYADDVKKVRNKGLSITEKVFVTAKNATTSTNGEVLLQTACFNQYDGYWNEKYSPYQEGEKYAPAGCSATAMAIIMAYNKWPAQGKGSNYYTSKTLGLKLGMDFSTIHFDWNNMPTTTYKDNTWTETQKDIVPQLLLACGISEDTDYRADGSSGGSNKVLSAMTDNFSYSIDYTLIDRNPNSVQEADWDVVRTSINDNHPVLVEGYGKRGSHDFVLDGYNDTYYHYNMGWGGSNNAWFANGSISYDNYYIYKIVGGIKPQQNIILETETVSGITYSIKDDGVMTISGTGTTPSNLLKNSKYSSHVTKCVINEGITKLGASSLSFESLGFVKELDIPASLTSIPVSNLYFTYLVTLNVADGNTAYCSLNDNSLYDKNKTKLIRAGRHFSFTQMPATATTIDAYAFYNSSITSITIPDFVKTINKYAFSYCYDASTIVIGKSVSTIAENAFKKCTGISKITCWTDNVPKITSTTFDQVPTDAILYVPEPSLNLYKNAAYWNNFATILPIQDTTIDNVTTDVPYPATNSIYDTSGKRLTTLQSGINIIIKNGKTIKVLVK